MSHPKVRRLLTAVALVLVLAAAAPALAAPGPRPHAAQAPVAGFSPLERFLDWLGFPTAEALPGQNGRYQKSTTRTPVSSSTSGAMQPTLDRGTMLDPNG
jgi:hypothetical protein